MKQFKFTLASDRYTGTLVLIACSSQGTYYPWPIQFRDAAYEVGKACQCNQCHNCEIFQLLETYLAGNCPDRAPGYRFPL
jgi:hypothetical protein